MTSWIFLSLAVATNVVANLMFKKATTAFPAEVTSASLVGFAFNPHLWLGGLSAALLLGCYLLAIREAGLSNSYAFVTSLSLVGITIAAAFTFGETVSLQSVIGIGLVIGGIFLISNAQAADATLAPRQHAELSSGNGQ